MPKIIEEVQQKILIATKEQMLKSGYSAVTIRNVAEACNIATGTVYNYYPSKDVLIASVMLEDWSHALRDMKDTSENANKVNDGLKAIYLHLTLFQKKYMPIWSAYTMKGNDQEEFRNQHKLLVRQLTSIIDSLLANRGLKQTEFTCTFLAESLLTAAREEMAFEPLVEIFDRILQDNAYKQLKRRSK